VATGGGIATGGGAATGGGVATGGGIATGGGVATGGGAATGGGVADGGIDAGTGFRCDYTHCSNCTTTSSSEDVTLTFSGNLSDQHEYIQSDSYSIGLVFNLSSPQFARSTPQSTYWNNVAGQINIVGGVTQVDAGVYSLSFNGSRGGPFWPMCPQCVLINTTCYGTGNVQ
jgi:hypothetical protein